MESRGVIEIENRNGVTIVRFGAAAISAADGMEIIAHDLRQLVTQSQPTKMIVDFSLVVFLSSQMLGLLVDVWRRLKDCGGTLVISGINPNLTRVFRITNLDKVFQFFPDVELALKALARPTGN